MPNDETQLRDELENFWQALRVRDVDAVISFYADDVESFDVIGPPLAVRGRDAVRRRLEEWLESFAGPIGYDASDLRLAVAGDVAFCSSFNRVSGRAKNGNDVDMWIRVTAGLRKLDGRWRITHEHVSVPFDMQTMKAELTLAP